MLSRLMPKVSVVTVNYNGKVFLRQLITSLQCQTLAPAEIIVVDNASDDGSLEYL
ncbi:glycosyltransferase family 2 protein, partial [Pseudomonas piscis]|uniref:glycosyltransferase family 2 protein n=1 Tax=Pseudomonas piscis TaxID=2614538 RepID=UPI0034A0B2A8